MEQIIFYALMFIIGTVFGSFFTLAVYRIPLKQDITHERSFCPKCNHKLSFWDMIPVLSYIFLGGKCRYCKEKIRIRYLLLEILTGTVFLLFAISLDLSLIPFDIYKIIGLFVSILYIAGIIIIIGIDKENRKIEKSLIIYEISILCLYMVYLYIVEKTNIYIYAIYLLAIVLLLILDKIYLKNNTKNKYFFEILELSIIMIIYGGKLVYASTAIITLLTIALENIIRSIFKVKSTQVDNKVSFYRNLHIGFYLGISNIISLIMINFNNI